MPPPLADHAHTERTPGGVALPLNDDRWRWLVDRHPAPTFVVVAGQITYANRAAAMLLAAPDPSDLCARPMEDFLPADDVGRIDRHQRDQLGTDRPAPFEHTVIRLDGDERWVECVSVPFPDVDGGVQTVLRDVTQRRASEERYRTFIESISEGVWRVELDRPVPRHASPRIQADRVLSSGRFAELNPAMVRMFGGGHPSPTDVPIGTLLEPYGRALIRAFVESGHRLAAHEIAVPSPDGTTRHLSVNAVGRMDRDELTEIWGSCTDITDRVEMERGMVDILEEQQERIGRDLHDSVGQLLTGVRMLSEGLAERPELVGAEGEPDETARRIAAYSAEALDRVRTICRGLVPPQLYSEGASGALAELAEHVDALGPTRCVFRHDGGVDLFDPDAALQVYRIAQEAISNALRHADAETVWVTLSDDEGDLLVEVEDDGVGFLADAERGRSVGLYSMTRRAHSVGAALTIETAPGAGTTVRVTLPAALSRTDTPRPAPQQGDASGK